MASRAAGLGKGGISGNERCVHSLPLFVRLQGRPVILLGSGDAAVAKRQILQRAGAQIVGEDAQAMLAIVALEDDADAHDAIARLRARGILVNAVDRPALCDFTLPAIIDRDPVLIAVGTGGASAGLAKALRQRLEAILPQSLGALASALKAARSAIRARWPVAADRRRGIDAALDPHGLLDPLSEFRPVALKDWLSSAEPAFHDKVITLTIASDDPDDLTLRQARLLGQADTVYHHSKIAPAILSRARADAVRIASESPSEPPPAGLTLLLVSKPEHC